MQGAGASAEAGEEGELCPARRPRLLRPAAHTGPPSVMTMSGSEVWSREERCKVGGEDQIAVGTASVLSSGLVEARAGPTGMGTAWYDLVGRKTLTNLCRHGQTNKN